MRKLTQAWATSDQGRNQKRNQNILEKVKNGNTAFQTLQHAIETIVKGKFIGLCAWVLHSFSHVRLFVTPWTIAYRLLCPWDSAGKNTGVGCHALLQGIFPTQGSNPHLWHLWHFRQILYPLSHLESPFIVINTYIKKKRYLK